MKKLFFMLVTAWAALLLFAACERGEQAQPPAVPADGTSVLLPDGLTPKIGYAEAVGIAQRGISMLESTPATRTSAGRRALDLANVKYVVKPATRVGESPDTLMYVFNFADSAGFALVAPVRESDQLLAVTEKGTYTPGIPTGNPGFDLYMQCAEQYLSTISLGPGGGGLDPVGPAGYIYKLDYVDDIDDAGPFIAVKWGQYSPYDTFCPVNKKGEKCVVGCVATAITQMLTYFKAPDEIPLTYKNADISRQVLNWPAINRHVKTYECGSNCTEHQAIGRLCRQLGQWLNMDYGSYNDGGSTAFDSAVPGCLKKMNYTSGSVASYKYEKVRNSLAKRYLVYAGGYDEANEGHAWVMDGYKTVKRTTRVWRSISSNGPWTLDKETVSVQNYVHCNWGWSGSGDGFYSDGPYRVDNYYTSTMTIIVDIHPK